MKRSQGFTLMELLVVIALVGIIASVVIVSLDRARAGSRDMARFQQTLEFMKALELYYTETGVYANDGSPNVPIPLSNIGAQISSYIPVIPKDFMFDDSNGYMYCSSPTRSSMAILINTENDKGGSDRCAISVGPEAYTESVCSGLSALDRCETRISK